MTAPSAAETASTQITFGTDGWRALMTAGFTEDNVDLVARAICAMIAGKGEAELGLVIGYDTRDKSRVFAEVCAARALEAGIAVHLPERPIPTPVTAFAITHHRTAGGIMITASHNPASYNGIKFISSLGGPSGPDVTSSIERRIAELRGESSPRPVFSANSALLSELDVIGAYRTHLATLVDYPALRRAGLKVAIDAMHGAGYGLLSDILREDAGCEVIALRDTPDPSFGGSMPDPTPSHLIELRDTVVRTGCTVGLALDGDADRFGVIDSEGHALTPNQVLSALADHLLRQGREGAVVRTVATTHLLDRIAEGYGRGCVETPVGFKWIAAEMVNGGVAIGGEESGGLSIAGHMPEKDGILADLLLAELACECGGRLAQKYGELLSRYGPFVNRRIDLEIDAGRKDALMAGLKSSPPTQIGGDAVVDVVTIDGVKLILACGDWVLFRASGTEPLVRVYVESTDHDRFERLAAAAGELALAG